MQHLDDGTLQAWLDGSRSGMGVTEREEVERHLESCIACVGRAAELEGTTRLVHALLPDSDGGNERVPEYEAVVARARAHELGSRRPSPWTAAAWAAGVAALLGVGWLSNDLYRGATADVVAAQPAGGAEASASEGLEEVVAEAQPADVAPEGPTPSDSPAPGAPRPLVAAATGPRVVRGRVTDEAGEPLAGVQVFVPGTGVGGLTTRSGDFRLELGEAPMDSEGLDVTITAQMIGYGEASRDLVARAGDTASADFQLERQALALDEIVVTGVGATARRELGSSARPTAVVPLWADPTWGGPWVAMSRAEAAARAGFSIYAVPELPVLGIEVSVVAGDPVVRIRQEIGDGAGLLLVEAEGLMTLREEALPDADERAFASVRRGDLWIAATAPIPGDSLRALLERLR